MSHRIFNSPINDKPRLAYVIAPDEATARAALCERIVKAETDNLVYLGVKSPESFTRTVVLDMPLCGF